jgi:hypothetical protein
VQSHNTILTGGLSMFRIVNQDSMNQDSSQDSADSDSKELPDDKFLDGIFQGNESDLPAVDSLAAVKQELPLAAKASPPVKTREPSTAPIDLFLDALEVKNCKHHRSGDNEYRSQCPLHPNGNGRSFISSQ